MADYTPTAANVNPLTAALNHGIAGAAINAGQLIYKDAADGNKLKVADALTAAKAAVVGMAVNTAAAAGQPIAWVASGEVQVTSNSELTNTIGIMRYISSTTAGASNTVDVVLDNQYYTAIGWPTAANKMYIAIQATGLVNPV